MSGRASVLPHALEPFLPGSYGLLLLSIVEQWGVASEELFDGFDLDDGALELPDSRVPVSVMADVIRRARSLTKEPGLGILVGLRTHTNTYGYLSFATMSAATLGQAMDIAIRFIHAASTAFTLRFNRAGGIAALIVEEECDLGDVRDVLLLGLLIGMRVVGCTLTGRQPWRPIDVAIPEPPYYRRFAHLVPELRFDQPMSQIVMLDSDLDLPLLTPDRAALRLAIEQCEKDMQSLGAERTVEERILRVLMAGDGPLPLEKVASALSLSPRTLKRRLSESGVTFSELVEKARRERAFLLLRSPHLSLDDVAERLGYSTVANLVRAFRRWTGITPSAYRRGVAGQLSVHLPLRR